MIKKNIMLSLTVLFAFLISLSASAITLKLAQGGGSQGKMTMELTAEWEKKTGHTVEFLEMPSGTSNIYVQYKTWLSAQNSDVDIYRLGQHPAQAFNIVEPFVIDSCNDPDTTSNNANLNLEKIEMKR